MVDIKASVGRGGKNRKPDVRAVQDLLNANLGSITPLPPLVSDGRCGNRTVRAIETFQRRVLKAHRPDGRVDPDGSTLRALSASLGAISRERYIDPPWLEIAVGEEGTRERAGIHANHPRILEYLATAPVLARLDHRENNVATSKKMGEVDETPWCACFVAWCLQQAGRSGGKGAQAKQWRGYGTHLSGPAVGAITVIYRPPFSDSASGWHVGFWIGGPPRAPILLGGNQNNSVCRKQFVGPDLVYYRWPP